MIAVVAMGMALSGCTPGFANPGGTTTSPASSGAPLVSASPIEPSPGPLSNPVPRDGVRQGGTLSLATAELPKTWNPWGWSPFDLDAVTDLLSPRLFASAADGQLHWDPAWLVSDPQVTVSDSGVSGSSSQGDHTEADAEPSPDPTSTDGVGAGEPTMTVDYALNPSARWSDGEPVTAADFIATYEACRALDTPVCRDRGFDHVTAVVAGVDPHHVQVSYDQVWADWPYTFARGPIRAQLAGDPVGRDQVWSTPIGHESGLAGPFVPASFDGTTLTLTPNQFWWGDPVKLEVIRVIAMDPKLMSWAYLRGQIDAFMTTDANVYSQAKQLPGIQTRVSTGVGARFLVFNRVDGPLSDPAVRAAVVTALDRADLGASDLAGLNWDGQLLNSPVWLTSQTQYEDLVLQSGVEPADLTAAGQLLDEAGWVLGDDGIRAKDGQPLAWDFVVPRDDWLSENEAFGVRAQLARLGVRLDLTYIESSQVEQVVATGEHGMWASTTRYRTPIQAAARFAPSGQWGWPESILGLMTDRAERELDEVERAKILTRAAQIVWHNAPVLPLYETPEILLTRPGLANFGPNRLGTIWWPNVGWTS
ncbi:MAG: ABC transporter substrate-binding protein [Propionibacteriaceae bacterium]|nr:ABC transporter substrate-binding protein [Propionibacteriaceae bacterium]